jgi:aminoglycoside phosphotransferase (APT) family kinase protein
VKIATTDGTAQALRAEWSVYGALDAGCMPELLGWDDDGDRPILVLEDLSGARWPPPWDTKLVERVVAVVRDLHRARGRLRLFSEVHGEGTNGWVAVGRAPEVLAATGLIPRRWLDRYGELLRVHAASVETQGTEVCHFDVRSDNLCQAERGIVLVDWNLACLGNGELDLGFWLPSLALEGGPFPQTILPDRGGIAAWVAGFFAARAGLPEIPDAPKVRWIQKRQLEMALQWACTELELPSPITPP